MSASELQFAAVADAATRTAARALLREYLEYVAGVAAAHYGLTFDIGAMVASDLDDPHKFYPPHGRFYLVRHQGAEIGVGCLKRITPEAAELQRMYVQPHARGLGAGRHLLERLLEDARAIGYESVRLESLKALGPAHALYRSAGFTEIDPYAANSMRHYQPAHTMDTYRASALFMELQLKPPSSPASGK